MEASNSVPPPPGSPVAVAAALLDVVLLADSNGGVEVRLPVACTMPPSVTVPAEDTGTGTTSTVDTRIDVLCVPDTTPVLPNDIG